MTQTGQRDTSRGRGKFRLFLAALTRLADKAMSDEAVVMAGVSEALTALIRHDDWLSDEFAIPNKQTYQQYLLYCDPLQRFSVLSFVWGPGQQTPIHDHTTWGVIGMLRGAELSETYEIRDGKPVSTGTTRLDPGAIALLSPRLGDIHRVQNAFDDRVSISIHIYGGDIGAIERHSYSEDGKVETFVSRYANSLLPNVWGVD